MTSKLANSWRRARLIASAAGIAFLISGAAPHSREKQRTGLGRAFPAGTILITVTGFRNNAGQAIVALYTSKESWLKSEKAMRLKTIKIDGATLTVRFDSLSPGVYAASAIHDENSNGKLDMHYLPIPHPIEGAGVSNNVRTKFGPPSWDDAKFTLADSACAITITLRY